MAGSLLAKKRGNLYRKVIIYTERRERWKKKLKRVQSQINNYNLSIARIDKKTKEIRSIANGVKSFKNIRSLRGGVIGEKRTIEKAMFYKYGLENGIKAINLKDYMGSTYNGVALNYKRWYDKMINKNVTYRQEWENFKQYMYATRKK